MHFIYLTIIYGGSSRENRTKQDSYRSLFNVKSVTSTSCCLVGEFLVYNPKKRMTDSPEKMSFLDDHQTLMISYYRFSLAITGLRIYSAGNGSTKSSPCLLAAENLERLHNKVVVLLFIFAAVCLLDSCRSGFPQNSAVYQRSCCYILIVRISPTKLRL